MSNSRFKVQPSETNGAHIITDTSTMLSIHWQAGDFNGTQKAIDLYDTSHLTVMELARSLREIGDYLQEHHANKL